MFLFYTAAVLFVTCLILGTTLWWPTSSGTTGKESRGNLGAGFLTAAATSCVVSLLFFALQLRADANAQHLQAHSEALATHLAAENAALQRKLAQKQSMDLQLALSRNLSGVDLSGQNLSNLDLSHKDLSGAVLVGTDLSGARLNNTNLSGAVLTKANLDNAYLRGANLSGAVLSGASLRNTYLDEARLAGADFGVYFVSFRGTDNQPPTDYGTRGGQPADLAGAQLEDAQMRGDCLARADLQGAKLGGADLAGADLDGANLRGAQFLFAGLPAYWHDTAATNANEAGRAVATGRMRSILRMGNRIPPRARSGKISQVFDGDTAHISHLGWIRLDGLTAPNHDWPYGPAAKQFVERFFGPSGTVRYVLARQRREPRWGDTGRWLVDAWNTRGRFLNEALLQNGLAVRGQPANQQNGNTPTRVVQGNPRYSAVLDTAASFARYTGRGLWRVCPKVPS